MNGRQADWTNPYPDGEKGIKKEGIRDNCCCVEKKKKQWHNLNSIARRVPVHCINAYMEMGFSTIQKKKKNCHCLRRFAFEDREWEASWGGGRPHANDANANLQAFFFFHGGSGLSCPYLPAARIYHVDVMMWSSKCRLTALTVHYSKNPRILVYILLFFGDLSSWLVNKMH